MRLAAQGTMTRASGSDLQHGVGLLDEHVASLPQPHAFIPLVPLEDGEVVERLVTWNVLWSQARFSQVSQAWAGGGLRCRRRGGAEEG